MLELTNISKHYRKGSTIFTALDNISLKVEKGNFIVITGLSGSGKSTLLYVIGGMINPDSGNVRYKGKSIYDLNNREKNDYRKEQIGFVFQQFHLMPFLTVKENIRLACHGRFRVDMIDSFIEKCSLMSVRDKFPSELSVGEKQRTAFVRAIIGSPDLLLADEPTGNLDPENSEIIMQLMDDFHKNGGTILLVSHNPGAAKYACKQIILNKGKISDNK